MSNITNLFKDYGTEGIIIVCFIGGLYAVWEAYVKYIFQKKYKDYDNKNNSHNENLFLEERKKALHTQEFFPNIQFKINVDIPSEEFSSDEVMRCLYKNIMLSLFESYYDNMSEFVKSLDISWDKNEWANALNTTNYKIIEDFKAICAQREIPKEAVKYFIIWYTPLMQQIYFFVRKIAAMNNKSSVENTNTYLLLLELILMNTLSDVKNFDILDNEFEGLEYKGNIINKPD